MSQIQAKTLTAALLVNTGGSVVSRVVTGSSLHAVNHQVAADPLLVSDAPSLEPISAADAAEQGRQWAELQSHADRLCWLEFDATLGSNRIRFRQSDQPSTLITPSSFSVRSRVHEYGGGSFRLLDNAVVFVNDRDQGLYWQDLPSSGTGQLPQPRLLRQAEGFRYADLQYDSCRQRLIAVEEQHSEQGVVNRLVAIRILEQPLLGNQQQATRKVLVEGDDFYSSPRLSADGSQLAWISWNHPEQPWTATRLWLGGLDSDGVPQGQKKLTNGHYQGRSESVVQPEFGPDGSLFFLSDRSGWWNLYRCAGLDRGLPARCAVAGKGAATATNKPVKLQIDALLPQSSEFCRAPWQLGQQAYVVIDDQHIGCSWWQEGKAELGVLQVNDAHLTGTAVITPVGRSGMAELTSVGCWAAVHSLSYCNGRLLAIAEPSTEPGQLVCCELSGQQALSNPQQASVLERIGGFSSEQSSEQSVDPSAEQITPIAARAVVEAEHVVIDVKAFDAKGSDASETDADDISTSSSVYGLLYRPQFAEGVEQSRVPLIIQLHGGPTAQADARFDPLKQFWLQRGFALLDLNYRGSTGYGREYRQQLKGQWGISDVEDVINAARFFSSKDWVDPQRIVVRGNSAGGYTCLQVLSNADGQQWLRTGASLYGISDLQRLAAETHKFESRYLDWLIGDPAEERERYRARSPIHRPQSFCRPLIFFQGGLDRVVPATQTYALYSQLKGRGLAVEYQAFADERHGFRQAKNRATVLQREWQFYQQQLGLSGAENNSSPDVLSVVV